MRKSGKHTAAANKGFYIILTFCAAIVAVSGYVLFHPTSSPTDGVTYTPQLSREQTAWKPASEPTDTAVEIPEEPVTASVSEPVIPETPPLEPTLDDNPDVVQTSGEIWVKPVNGEVVQAFSGDNLVYQQTFGDWRVHAGADYQAKSGTRVYAAADGTVSEITTDDLWNTCVTLTLSDGRTVTYRGLDGKPKVKQDSTVKAGDVIGTIAAVLPAETAEGAHIHVELRDKDGVLLDPENRNG